MQPARIVNVASTKMPHLSESPVRHGMVYLEKCGRQKIGSIIILFESNVEVRIQIKSSELKIDSSEMKLLIGNLCWIFRHCGAVACFRLRQNSGIRKKTVAVICDELKAD
jgi:hypothetical protein